MLPVTGRYFDQTDSFCFDLKRLNFHFAFLSLFKHLLHPFLGSKGEIRYRYRGTYLLNKNFLLYKFVTGTVLKKKKKIFHFCIKIAFKNRQIPVPSSVPYTVTLTSIFLGYNIFRDWR